MQLTYALTGTTGFLLLVVIFLVCCRCQKIIGELLQLYLRQLLQKDFLILNKRPLWERGVYQKGAFIRSNTVFFRNFSNPTFFYFLIRGTTKRKGNRVLLEPTHNRRKTKKILTSHAQFS